MTMTNGIGANPNVEVIKQVAWDDNPKEKFKFVEWSSNAKCKNWILASGHDFFFPYVPKLNFIIEWQVYMSGNPCGDNFPQKSHQIFS